MLSRFIIKFFARLCLGGCLIFCLASALSAQDSEQPRAKRELSEKAQEVFDKRIRPLLESSNWDAMAPIFEEVIPTFDRNSYDFALFNQLKAQALANRGRKEDTPAIISSLENALSHPEFFDSNKVSDMLLWVAQLLVESNPDRAETYFKRYIDTTKKPEPVAYFLRAFILYNRATRNGTATPEQVDRKTIEESEHILREALLLTPTPKEEVYHLLLATLQQQERYVESGVLLELLVSLRPDKGEFWEQLVGNYNRLATELAAQKEKDRYNLLTVISIERAQAHGFMQSPKDNWTLASLYYNLQQFGKFTELVETGLKNGTIESTLNNWLFLHYAYQDMKKPEKDVATLRAAQKIFPKNGQIDFLIAGILYQTLDRPEDALNAALSAVAKGGGDDPARVYLFIAYLGLDLGKLDVTENAINKLAAYPGVKKQVEGYARALKAAQEEKAARNAKL